MFPPLRCREAPILTERCACLLLLLENWATTLERSRANLDRAPLRRMLDALERRMEDPAAPGFVVHDHYVARLLELLYIAGAMVRAVGR